MQFTISEGESICCTNLMSPCLGNMADNALGQFHLWMALVTVLGVSKEESPFQARVRGSWEVRSLTPLLWMHHREVTPFFYEVVRSSSPFWKMTP